MTAKLDFLTETLGWAMSQPETERFAEWKAWAAKRIKQLSES